MWKNIFYFYLWLEGEDTVHDEIDIQAILLANRLETGGELGSRDQKSYFDWCTPYQQL